MTRLALALAAGLAVLGLALGPASATTPAPTDGVIHRLSTGQHSAGPKVDSTLLCLYPPGSDAYLRALPDWAKPGAVLEDGFAWNDDHDPNRCRPGFRQFEDGSWGPDDWQEV